VNEPLLLVEDDADAARLIDRALADAGFAVHRVATGEQGLDYLAAHPVAGVVLDYRLPLADGLQVLRRIRERRITVPVVMISSAASVELAVQAIKGDAADFVEKHHNYLPVLVDKMRTALADARERVGRHLPRPVCVGRGAERRLLADELRRATAGEGRVVLVTGDDGIGKTTLACEVEALARDAGALVLRGRCLEGAGVPAYWPWTLVLRGYEKVVGAERLRAELGPAARLLALPAADDPSLATGGPELGRFRLLDGVTQCLRRAAAERPLVLVLDDLHHADPSSLELLHFLAAEIRDAAVLIVATHRDGGTTSAHLELARLGAAPFATVVRLAGFSAAEVHEYVVAATGVRPPDALVRAVHAKTDGHPLLVAEVVRLLAADGRLGEEPPDGRLRVAIPDTRRHAVAARLAQVSAECRHVLAVAAVIGRECAARLLVRVVDDEAAVSRAVDEARDAGIVVVGDDDPRTYRFSHALVRDVLYEELSAPARASLHARVARALEVSITAADPPLAAIAHHYLPAASGSEDVATAVAYAIAAGDRAAAVMAHEEAARHYEHALRATERTHAAPIGLVASVLAKLAEARWCAGELVAARAIGRRLVRVAKDAGDPAMLATAALTFAGRLPGLGAIECDDEVVAELEQALAGLPPTATALRAMLMARLAEELTYSPCRTIDRGLAPKAIALARSLGDPGVLATVLRTTQWSVWTPDDVERRRQLAEEIVALAAQTGDGVLALDGELLRLWSALEHGEMDVARRQLALATRLAERLRLPYYTWITTTARACLDIATGRLDEAERIAEEMLERGEATNPTVRLFAGAQRGHIWWHRGQFDDLARWLQGVVGEFPMLAAAVDCSLVITYAEAGQRELAQAELTRFAADDFTGVPRNAMWLMNMTSLAEGCIVLGDVDAARRLYPLLAPFTLYNVMLVPAEVLSPVSRYMAGLAELLGDADAARRHYEEALVMGARTGTLQYVARTQLAYARFLRRSARAGDHERASQLVAGARAIASTLRLAPLLHALDVVTAEPSVDPGDAENVFQHRDDLWHVGFAGSHGTVRDLIGMEYLRRLIAQPGVPIAAVELASLGGEGILVESGGDTVLDRRAIAAMRVRMSELEDGIAARLAGEEMGDPDALRQELERLEVEFERQGRLFLSAAERARSAVTKAIYRAIREIAPVNGPLARHLHLHVKTGRMCMYVPDAVAPAHFEL
jgi:CheY-like chemotaxis protein/tetratricopeptide (TPR) repeat protein